MGALIRFFLSADHPSRYTWEMSRWCLAAILVVAWPLWAAETKRPGGKDLFHSPATNGEPWRDEDTGFAVPQKLGSFTMQGWSVFDDPLLGTQVRLIDNDAQARVDLYMYPCSLPMATVAEKQKAVETELAHSINNTMEMEKRGMFSDVKHQDATSDPINLLPSGSLPMVGAGVTMKIHQKTITGDDAAPVTSWHGIALFGTKFVKLRYTFPTSKGKEGEQRLNDLITRWKACLREPSFQAYIKPLVATCLADPLSAQAQDAAGAVLVYAEKSPFVSLFIGDRITHILEAAKKAAAGTELDLLRAFIVGGVDACTKNQAGESTEASAANLIKVYHMLKEKHQGYKIDLLDDLEKAMGEHKAKEWLEQGLKRV